MFQVYSKVIQLYICIFCRFFFITGYYKILNIVPYAIQQVLVYFIYPDVYLLILIYPFLPSPL